MKLPILVLAIVIPISFIYAQNDLQSTKKKIAVYKNECKTDWWISPEMKPDRLKMYCEKETNSVRFITDIDSATFLVSSGDTINFKIILNIKDTAYTEIVVIKNLPATISNDDKLFWLSQIWSET
jgi:hypothetical protein